MKILSLKEVRDLQNSAKPDLEVKDLLSVIVREITSAAKRGDGSVVMSGARYVMTSEKVPLRVACNSLIGEGYIVEKYDGSEMEETCFGTGSVGVRGIKISW